MLMKQPASRWVELRDSDDLAQGFELPDGPLHLHLRTRCSSIDSDSSTSNKNNFKTALSRPQSHSSLLSDTGDETSGSGSALFSDSETSEPLEDYSQTALSASLDGGDQDSADEDEKCSTIKANQLPASFTAQLAAAKAQAALTRASGKQDAGNTRPQHPALSQFDSSLNNLREWNSDLETYGDSSSTLRDLAFPKASLASSGNDQSVSPSVQRPPLPFETDIENDFDLPIAMQRINLSPAVAKHSNSPESAVSTVNSLARPYSRAAAYTSPIQARSHPIVLHTSESVLGQVRPALASCGIRHQAKVSRELEGYVEKCGDRFEDGLLIEDHLVDLSADKFPAASEPGLRDPRKLTRKFSRDDHLLNPNTVTIARPASIRSLRPSRSSSTLLTMATPGPTDSNTPKVALPASPQRARSLRAKSSVSSLAARLVQPLMLTKKRSFPVLPGANSETLQASKHIDPRISASSSPSSHMNYARPTRASLARQSSVSEDGPSTLSYSHHFRSQLAENSPSASGSKRPSSPASRTNTMSPSPSFTRLSQGTVASRARARHIPTGSDPSGRSSASLGRPIPPTTSADNLVALPPYHAFRQSHRASSAFGNGRELEDFDDLPVDKEQETRFTRLPRARKSTELAQVDTYGQYDFQDKRGKRERMENVPEISQIVNKRLVERTEQTRDVSLSSKGFAVPKRTSVSASSGKERKRPGLQLIKNIGVSNLAKREFLIVN